MEAICVTVKKYSKISKYPPKVSSYSRSAKYTLGPGLLKRTNFELLATSVLRIVKLLTEICHTLLVSPQALLSTEQHSLTRCARFSFRIWRKKSPLAATYPCAPTCTFAGFAIGTSPAGLHSAHQANGECTPVQSTKTEPAATLNTGTALWPML